MKVLNCLFDDRFGGPHKRVFDVADRLMESGVETVVCLPSRNGNAHHMAKAHKIKVCGVKVSRVPRITNLGALLKWVVLLPRDIWAFRRIFRSEKPDVIHVNGAFFVAPAFAAKIMGLPLVWHLNDTIVPKSISRVLGVMVSRIANEVVVASKSVARHYQISGCDFTIIYAPVDCQKFKHLKKSVETEVGVPNQWRVGFVGNWSPVKGVEYFVRAMAIVKSNMTGNLKLLFAGSRMETHKKYCDEIDALIERVELFDNCEFFGFVSAIENVFQELDLLVLTSTSEACPIAVLEAMAAGVPVVATNVGGVEEILLPETELAAGVVVPSCDDRAIAEGVLKVFAMGDKARLFGESGRERIDTEFSLDVCVSRHLFLYQNLFQ